MSRSICNGGRGGRAGKHKKAHFRTPRPLWRSCPTPDPTAAESMPCCTANRAQSCNFCRRKKPNLRRRSSVIGGGGGSHHSPHGLPPGMVAVGCGLPFEATGKSGSSAKPDRESMQNRPPSAPVRRAHLDPSLGQRIDPDIKQYAATGKNERMLAEQIDDRKLKITFKGCA